MASAARRVAINSSFLFLGDIVSRLLHLVLIIFIARELGDIGYGKYAFAFAFTSLFIIFSDFGLSILSIREIARDKSKASKYLSNVSIVKAILSLITFALIVIVINLMDYPQDTTQTVYIVGLIVVFSSFTQFFRSIFRAFERMEYEMMTRIVEETLVIGAGLTVLFLGYGLLELVSVILVARFLMSLFSLAIVIKRFTAPELSLDIPLAKQLIKAALPFGLMAIFLTIYFQIDSVMLSVMKGDAVVGWYNAAYQLVLALMFIPAAFIGSLYPLLSRYFKSSKDSLRITYEKSFKYLLILAIPLGIGTTLVADKVIALLYGAGFANSVIALQILVWAVSLIFLTSLAGHTMASIDKQWISVRNMGIGALLNIILNLLLIPPYSYIGAAVATVATELTIFVLYYHYLQRHLYRLPMHRVILKPLAAALIMGIIVYGFDFITTNVFIIVLGAILSYGVLLYLLRVFGPDEIRLIRDFYKERQ
ncbi:MAG TPA: flippase [Dehalococcoidia bacterium]|jgi:O-antigen/teichoic acid export membrane protein|nr:flippase [Dehalococcoidia bacterium]